MNSVTTEYRSKDGRTPTNVMLLANPLDFIAEDHLRLRMMCSELDQLAQTTEIDPDACAAMFEYLHHELPLLLGDEEEDLMPRILSRAEPEDELPKLTERLEKEHAAITDHLKAVVSGLATVSPEVGLPDHIRNAMQELANATRRHLILENAVLMPIARARLEARDLHALRAGMLKRRGLENLFKT